jgi:hypothetical protein
MPQFHLFSLAKGGTKTIAHLSIAEGSSFWSLDRRIYDSKLRNERKTFNPNAQWIHCSYLNCCTIVNWKTRKRTNTLKGIKASATLPLIEIHWMGLISARSISLDSTFKVYKNSC